MIQIWSIRSRAHQCALSARPFEEGETFHTAIYFDPETNGYLRRDVGLDSWKQELKERQPVAYWKTVYSPTIVEEKPEVASKEGAMSLLQRFIEEDEPHTENARYILALMLERKRILSPTAAKETETGKVLFYENKKTAEVFMVRDPELRLDELVQLQDEVAALLGFGGPAAEAAKTAGMKFTPDGKLEKVEKGKKEKGGKAARTAEGEPPAAAESEATEQPAAEVVSETAEEEVKESAEKRQEDLSEDPTGTDDTPAGDEEATKPAN